MRPSSYREYRSDFNLGIAVIARIYKFGYISLRKPNSQFQSWIFAIFDTWSASRRVREAILIGELQFMCARTTVAVFPWRNRIANFKAGSSRFFTRSKLYLFLGLFNCDWLWLVVICSEWIVIDSGLLRLSMADFEWFWLIVLASDRRHLHCPLVSPGSAGVRFPLNHSFWFPILDIYVAAIHMAELLCSAGSAIWLQRPTSKN